jgi:uncharacterized membrane protein YqaE (UPF0057 family)
MVNSSDILLILVAIIFPVSVMHAYIRERLALLTDTLNCSRQLLHLSQECVSFMTATSVHAANSHFHLQCSCDLLINILLTVLGYLPGHVHAFWLIYKKVCGFACVAKAFCSHHHPPADEGRRTVRTQRLRLCRVGYGSASV